MEAVPIVGFALAVGLIVVVMARGTRNSRTNTARSGDGSFAWWGGDAGGSSDCGDGGGGGCGDGGGGGGGGD